MGCLLPFWHVCCLLQTAACMAHSYMPPVTSAVIQHVQSLLTAKMLRLIMLFGSLEVGPVLNNILMVHNVTCLVVMRFVKLLASSVEALFSETAMRRLLVQVCGSWRQLMTGCSCHTTPKPRLHYNL